MKTDIRVRINEIINDIEKEQKDCLSSNQKPIEISNEIQILQSVINQLEIAKNSIIETISED